jgi:precorrin-6A/cobalt-precorrin-6A reductase
LTKDEFVVGRGPFSVQNNVDLIRRHGAQLLVSKDSGQAGGLHTKIEAAKQENCKIVVVTRKNSGIKGVSKFHQLAIEAKKICNG